MSFVAIWIFLLWCGKLARSSESETVCFEDVAAGLWMTDAGVSFREWLGFEASSTVSTFSAAKAALACHESGAEDRKSACRERVF